MILFDTFLTAVRALGINKMRTGLTMLGIVIGVGAVIALIAAGQGAQKGVTEKVRGLGSNLIFVRPAPTAGGGVISALATTLTDDDAQAINDPNRFPQVLGVAPQSNSSAQAIANGQNVATTFTAADYNYPSVRNFYPAVGRFIDTQDDQAHALVAVLGSQVAQELYGDPESAMDQNIRLSFAGGLVSFNFRIIGVMQSLGSSDTTNQDDQVFVPLSTLQTRIPFLRNPLGKTNVLQITVRVDKSSHLQETKQEVHDLLLQRHDGKEDFTVLTQDDLLSTANEVSRTLTILLGAIAGISLVVGGIGIMNIMLVSVTERTREIGIRKAVGARRRDILLQFVVEALIVTILGGAIGIAAGVAAAKLGSGHNFGGDSPVETVVTPLSIFAAFGISAAIGLFFGIYPAFRASRLDPIEALRTE
ncbi:MAG TPA: ABC transporter permease [Dehalococcoidia bacterium]|nr:ABC transporter permease [Dehalococcoidia bacterium]